MVNTYEYDLAWAFEFLLWLGIWTVFLVVPVLLIVGWLLSR